MADLWMVYRFECKHCHEPGFVQDDPRKGDKIVCPHCNKKDKVGAICGECRSSDGPKELETLSPHDFF